MKKITHTIKDIKNQLRILEASQLFRICDAVRNIEKCGIDRYTGSAVTITIRNLNVDINNVVEEVCINDGLSPETIQAIQQDLRRSYALVVDHPVNQLPAEKEIKK